MGREKAQLLSSVFTLFLGLQIQMQQMFVLLYLYGLLYEQSLVTNIASIREYRRRRRNQRQHPYYWTLPRPNESWFEIHYYDPTIPDDFFRQQLRMRRTTFQMLLNAIAPRITRLNTRFRNCVPPEKVLAPGLFRLAHGNSHISIAPAMNVGKSTVIHRRRTGRGRGGGASPPHFFADGIFFNMRTPGIPNQKSQADADMQPI